MKRKLINPLKKSRKNTNMEYKEMNKGAILGLVVLGSTRKQAEKAMRSKQVSK